MKINSQNLRNIIFALFLLLPLFSVAQTKKADSLLLRLKSLGQDSERAKTLNSLSDAIRGRDPAKATEYADEALTLSEKINFTRGLVVAYQYKGDAVKAAGKIDESIKIYQEGIVESKKRGQYRSLCSLNARIGFSYMSLGKFTEAILFLREDLRIADSIHQYDMASDGYRGIGMAYTSLGEHDTATANFIKAIEMAEKTGQKDQIGYAYVTLGNSQQYQHDYAQALTSFNKALDIFKNLDNDYGLSGCYISIGNIYLFTEDYDNALKNYNLTLSIREKMGDVPGIASVKENIGTVLLKQNKPEEALNYFLDGIETFRKLNDNSGIAGSYNNLGNVYLALKRYKESEDAFQKSIIISRQFGLNQWLKDSYSGISELYFNTERFKEAYLYKDSLAQINNKIIGDEHAQQSKEMEAKYENRKNEEEIKNLNAIRAEQDKVQEKQHQIIVAVSIGLGLVVLLSFFLFRISAERRKANLRLEDQNKIIAEKNKDITDSINYALRIQKSVLPDEKILQKSISDYFIFNRPRDIVSGDFYWLAQKDDFLYVAVADCTGHGVPGALVSVVGINMLNKIIEQPGNFSPSEILEKLHKLVINALNKDADFRESNDGMDVGLLSVNKKSGKAIFSGAGRPLYYSDKNGLHFIKGDRYSVAGEKKDSDSPFTEIEIPISEKTNFYLSSDGFVDQFGEASGKKYLSKRFQELLQSISTLPMKEQQAIIEHEFSSWKGKLEQVDDVMVLGIQV